MLCITILLIFFLVAVDAAAAATQHYFHPPYDPLAAWIHEQSRYARSRILANIAPFADDPHAMPGAVCASPSRARPDYYYAWTRDSSLVMNEILSWPPHDNDNDDTDIVLEHYVAFTRHVQALHSTYGLGEAKYHMDGSVFTGSWCNAQTDGPAIRALALIRLAERRLPLSVDPLFGIGAPIRVDLDYVARVWWQNGHCDIWEESRGLHFYTALAQHHALKAGAKMALRVGDNEAGERYARVAADIEVMLREKFTTRPHLPTTIEWSGGLSTKHSNLDTQVLLASLHFAKEGAFSVHSSEMLSTVLAILRRFESLYDINRVTNTEIYGISVPLGVAAGRYPEDVYDGIGTSRGNPWSLVTSALAEYHYRLALAYAQTERLAVSPELTALLEWTAPYLHSGGKFNATLLYSRDGYQDVSSYLLKAGDLYMARVARHTDRDHTMYEQWNRHTGYGQGAKHLTWSYAAHMSAARARSELISTINGT